MSRLIDADALLDKLKGTPRYFDLKHDIEEMPTVFDVDAVFKKMWRESEEVCGNTMIEVERANEIILEALSGGVE